MISTAAPRKQPILGQLLLAIMLSMNLVMIDEWSRFLNNVRERSDYFVVGWFHRV